MGDRLVWARKKAGWKSARSAALDNGWIEVTYRFDLTESGAIDCHPLAAYRWALLMDAICLLRLEIARPEDQHGTGSIVCQLTLSAVQLRDLAEALLDAAGRIEKALKAPH